MLPTTFAEAIAVQKELRCPKCGKPLICMYGGGWDYDIIFCSLYGCAWEHQYDTTTYMDEE